MSITRLQQARQMFRYGGDTMGGPNDKSNDGLGDTGDFGSEKANVANTKSAETNLGMDSRDRAIANQYKNMPTPTVTVGVDKFDNPITVPTTYQDKRNRQKTLDALNKKGIKLREKTHSPGRHPNKYSHDKYAEEITKLLKPEKS